MLWDYRPDPAPEKVGFLREEVILLKILFIRFSSLGDIILTTPCVRLLKEKYPDSKIYYAVKKNLQEFFIKTKI